MKIGEYEIEDGDILRINSIMSDFLNASTEVIGGLATGAGRSVQEDKQYRLNINNRTFASVKLRYDEKSYHQAELVVHEVRELLKLPNYDVKRVSGFPMNGEKWRNGDCLLIDWGIQNNRIDLATLEPSSLSEEDKEIFFDDVATNGALSYCIGMWDRDNRNFVWDKKDKRLISIDHESFLLEDFDLTIPSGISNVLTRFFGDNWYDDKDLSTKFRNTFSSVWFTIAKKQEEITEIFGRHGWTGKLSMGARIEKGPNIPLGLIMMPAVDR